jgi:membrane-associated phospholipid phosphatase
MRLLDRRWWFLRTGRPGHLVFSPWIHGPPLVLSAALWVGSYRWNTRHAAPRRVRWREHPALDRLDLAVRRRVRWENPQPARAISNFLADVAVPAVAAALSVAAGRNGGGGPLSDLLVANEAMFHAGAASQVVKMLARRQRPFSRFAEKLPEAIAGRVPDDDNLSFLSSHTSTTTAFAFAVAEIATRRRVRTPLTMVLGAMAGLTGYLRVASDRHYVSDVLAGAALGAFIGTAVPRLLHPVR